MAALAASVAVVAMLPVAGAKAATWEIGDVFANTPDGPTALKVFDNSGNFKEEFGDPSLTGEGTGCAFDSNRDLYATFFQMNQTFKFSNVHPHGVLGSPISNPGTNESIVFDASGNFYIGMADTAGDQVRKFDPQGNLLNTYLVQDDRGADWIDLAADQQTLFYNGEGRTVRRYDLATETQLPDFAVLPGAGNAFALRILPPGDGSGGVLVADGVDIKRLDGAGNVVQTYDAPSVVTWFALNLDPNGTSFWSADISGGQVFRFNIASGAVEVGPIEAHPSEVAGLCVIGELTAGVPPEPPAEPTVPGPPENPCATRINGTPAKDNLAGTAGSEEIKGIAGNDKLAGVGGDDCVRGGPGRDKISGGDGNDRLNGGQSHDKVSGGGGDDVIKVTAGRADKVSCGAGQDTVSARTQDKIASDCENVST